MVILLYIVSTILFFIVGVLLSLLRDYMANSPRIKNRIRPLANIICWSEYRILKTLNSLYKKGGIFSILSVVILLFYLVIGIIHIGLSIYFEIFSDYEYQKIKGHGDLGKDHVYASFVFSFLLCTMICILFSEL